MPEFAYADLCLVGMCAVGIRLWAFVQNVILNASANFKTQNNGLPEWKKAIFIFLKVGLSRWKYRFSNYYQKVLSIFFFKELLDVITQFRNEEQEHHDTGIDHGAEQAPFYAALTNVIKCGCKVAIAISKKI